MHAESMVILFAELALILAIAKVGAEICDRIKQPAVFGELIAGLLLGNVVLIAPSWGFFENIRHTAPEGGVQIVASIGVVLLLFEAGLETSVAEMRRVGVSSVIVAVVGVCVPFALGYVVSSLFITQVPETLLARAPQFPLYAVHLFIGATLSATSVGITARVFKDLNILRSLEARIVLGAAVIDDVIGLVILAIVNGVVVSAASGAVFSWEAIVGLCFLATAFLAGAMMVGIFIVPRILRVVAQLRTGGVMIASALVICFVFAAAAGAAGLAPIVGAFAGGLVLEDIHFASFHGTRTVRELIAPIVEFIGPVFFVTVGMQVHLENFMDGHVLFFATMLTIAAVLGKVISGWTVRKPNTRPLIIGVGMIPRGEVGLIFAGIGRVTGVIDHRMFAAVVLVVMITTMITPWLLTRVVGHRAILSKGMR